jgi:hypothetical protein
MYDMGTQPPCHLTYKGAQHVLYARLFGTVATVATIEVIDFVNPAFARSVKDQLLALLNQFLFLFSRKQNDSNTC